MSKVNIIKLVYISILISLMFISSYGCIFGVILFMAVLFPFRTLLYYRGVESYNYMLTLLLMIGVIK